jgi:hypothetical protein
MSDDFQGSHYIQLQPGDSNVPYAFRFIACSANTANDGAIPFGATMHKLQRVRCHEANSTAESTKPIASASLTSNTITAYLSWTTDGIIPGMHHVTIRATAVVGGASTAVALTRNYDFDRIVMRDK